jgi:hypothetical protein
LNLFTALLQRVKPMLPVRPPGKGFFAGFGGMDLPRAKESAPSNLTVAAMGGQKSPEGSY